MPVNKYRFDESLVLFKYLLSLFGKDSLDSLCQDMKADDKEGWDSQNISNFYHHLTNQFFDFPGISKEKLLQYDQNITSHTLAISNQRDQFRWKYFQYMALLFTEIYLDNYFNNQEKFLEDLNALVQKMNQEREEQEKINPYKPEDLNKIAFWQATGSGKTLIMHINVLQYKHYLEKSGRRKELNKIILLTPNEGLSEQHKTELIVSGLSADIFNKDDLSLYAGRSIEIIEISKLAEQGKEKTVSVDAFEGNNLVLVDEGHRGSGGEVWLDMRNRICENGFSFEYSATFGQAMKAVGKNEIVQTYKKCILFDYSYKYFYSDGYGKDYSILNLAEDHFDNQRQLYLTACLLSFYQQLKIYEEKKRVFAPYFIEEPLWVFVGSSVNAVRSENKKNVSDVIDILNVLQYFLNQTSDSVNFIDRLLNGCSQLQDNKGNDLFAGRFSYLIASYLSPEDIYQDIRKVVFNNPLQGAKIHIDNLKGVQGEIGLRLGEADYFGVINVSDDAKLISLCEENEFDVSSKEFSQSLFHKLSSTDSKVKILIGSKKFTEGWNSWRVSTMGLMNVGRSEGSEIIQLFGRGVRLKGYHECLKRSSALYGIQPPKYIDLVETLNIFGVRANYMKQFRDYLEVEGVKGSEDLEEIKIPCLPCLHNLGNPKLKVPQLKKDVNFKKNGPKPCLEEPDKYLKKNPVVVNWYPKIEAMQSKSNPSKALSVFMEGKLGKEQCAFIDYDALFFDLQKYKNERCYYNLSISKNIIQRLLERQDWYILYIPEQELQFTSFEKVRLWQEIASALLKKYCDRFYNARQLDYEKDKIEFRYIDEVEAELIMKEKSGNLFDEFTFLVEKSKEDIIVRLKQLKAQIESGEFKDWNFQNISSFVFDRHLYKPLIHIDGTEVKVMPVALNKGEKTLVEDLKKFYISEKSYFVDRELYLLRNLGRGRGISFFQANNFYPDFIMWLVTGDKQQIIFLDPHGIRMIQEGFNDPKIQFAHEIKLLEQQIGDPLVTLESFIISITPFNQVGLWDKTLTRKDFEEKHVLFQENEGYVRKLFERIGRKDE